MAKVPDGLRSDLTAAVEQESTLFGNKKSLLAASEALRDGETVVAATTTMMQRMQGVGRRQTKATQNGVLIITDQRLLFVHARGFAQSTEEMPLSNITGVVERRGMVSGHIEVTAAGGITTEFRNITKARVLPVLEAIRSHLAAPAHRPSPGQAPTATSVADELMKLAGLRDAGILSEEEFAAAKARLIG